LSPASPLSFEEIIYSLNGGGSSAPEKSATTYRLLQIAPEAIQREIFARLQEFWAAVTTPDQWKRVLLILIQKNSEKPAMMGNFRPIGLLEILRKVWTKMLIWRILPLLDSQSVLQPNQFAFLPGRGTSSELIQLNVLEEVAECSLEVDLTTSDVKGVF
jgi:hypothetical protein